MKIAIEDAPLPKLHLVRDSFFLGILARLFQPLGIDVDAGRTRTVLPGGGYDEPSVAAAEVVHNVAPLNVCELQHRRDDVRRRGNVRNVKMRTRFLGGDRKTGA